MREKILELLDSLRFKGMAQILDQELDRAEREGTAVSEVLYRLLLKE
ncbi:MAG: ATP-binding protein, partial [Thermotogae bacterium]